MCGSGFLTSAAWPISMVCNQCVLGSAGVLPPRPLPSSPSPKVCAICIPSAGCPEGVNLAPLCTRSGRGTRVLRPTHPFPSRGSLLGGAWWCGGVRGLQLPVARARARARRASTRRVRGRARAPWLQLSARSEQPLLPLSDPRGSCCYRLLPPPRDSVHWAARPKQEDELEEDAWAREYLGGCGLGRHGGRKMVSGLSPFPRAAMLRGWGRCPGPPSGPRVDPPPAHIGGRERAPVSKGAGAGSSNHQFAWKRLPQQRGCAPRQHD